MGKMMERVQKLLGDAVPYPTDQSHLRSITRALAAAIDKLNERMDAQGCCSHEPGVACWRCDPRLEPVRPKPASGYALSPSLADHIEGLESDVAKAEANLGLAKRLRDLALLSLEKHR